MTDESGTRKTVTHRRRAGIVAGVAAAGIAAGLVAVYGMNMAGGNAVPAECAPSVAVSRALAPFAKGDVAAFITSGEPVDAGGLTFRGPDGTPTTLKAVLGDVPGRIALVNLWATWCVPCREEMPALDRLEAAHGSDRFEVVAVNVDTRDDGRAGRFLKEENISALKLYSDPTMKVFNDLKSRGHAVGLPTTVLVDSSGCTLGVMHGPAEWDSPDAVGLIGEALAQTAPKAAGAS